MKILFYGACHIGALERILTSYTAAGTLQTKVLQNFQMIQQGTPFPVDSLREYDAMVFNPLFTRGDHNTQALVEACDEFGVRHISLPLMEWRGYFPGLTKGRFGMRSTWHYAGLYKTALEFDTFPEFEEYVVDVHVPEKVEANVANSTSVASRTEELGLTDVRVAPFIAENYARERLFLTPGHPARGLYHYVIRELARLLEVDIDPSFYWSSYEPQAGFKDVILPGTTRALDLQFRDAEFQRADVFSDRRVLPLREYLKLYYYGAREAMVFGAKSRTHLKRTPGRATSDVEEGSRLACEIGDLLIAMPAGPGGAEQAVTVVSSNRYPEIEGEQWYVYTPHWSLYEFSPKKAVDAASSAAA